VTLVAQGQSGHQASQTVIIRPGEATRLQLTGFPGSQQAGNPFLLNIQAYDTSGNEAIGYTGNKLLTFGGASVSDNGDAPYVDSVAQPFGASTAVTFDSAGHATVGATLFAAETAAITVTDSLISSNAFALLVLPGPFVQFDLRLATPQQAGVAFSGTNVLRAEDLYGNPTDYDAFSDPVTIAPLAPAGGDVAGLGGPNGDQLNQSSDFVDGVANLTGRLLYSGTVGGAIFEASSFFASDNSELVQIDAGPPYTITIEDPNPGLQPQVAQRKEYRVQLYDILGNPAVAGDNRTVMLSVTGVDPVGAFYDGPGPEASIISNVAINSGAGSATFFYQPATSGSQELSGNDGVTPQIAPLTINVP
jgi:hypothetical protein